MVTPRHMSKRVKRVKQAGSAQKPKQGRSGVATADPWNHVKGVPRGTISEDLWNAFPETKSVSKYYTCTRCARYFTHDVMHYECSGREGGPPEPSDIAHCDRVPSGAPVIGKGDHSLQILVDYEAATTAEGGDGPGNRPGDGGGDGGSDSDSDGAGDRVGAGSTAKLLVSPGPTVSFLALWDFLLQTANLTGDVVEGALHDDAEAGSFVKALVDVVDGDVAMPPACRASWSAARTMLLGAQAALTAATAKRAMVLLKGVATSLGSNKVSTSGPTGSPAGGAGRATPAVSAAVAKLAPFNMASYEEGQVAAHPSSGGALYILLPQAVATDKEGMALGAAPSGKALASVAPGESRGLALRVGVPSQYAQYQSVVGAVKGAIQNAFTSSFLSDGMRAAAVDDMVRGNIPVLTGLDAVAQHMQHTVLQACMEAARRVVTRVYATASGLRGDFDAAHQMVKDVLLGHDVTVSMAAVMAAWPMAAKQYNDSVAEKVGQALGARVPGGSGYDSTLKSMRLVNVFESTSMPSFANILTNAVSRAQTAIDARTTAERAVTAQLSLQRSLGAKTGPGGAGGDGGSHTGGGRMKVYINNDRSQRYDSDDEDRRARPVRRPAPREVCRYADDPKGCPHQRSGTCRFVHPPGSRNAHPSQGPGEPRGLPPQEAVFTLHREGRGRDLARRESRDPKSSRAGGDRERA